MGTGQEITEQFVAVIVAEVPDHAPAGSDLGPDKIKKGIVHIAEERPDRLVDQCLLPEMVRLHGILLDPVR